MATPLAAGPDFVHEVVPILKKNCAECHTGTKKKGGFSMNTEESFRKGSEDGPVVDPAQPEKSLILKLVATADEDLADLSDIKPVAPVAGKRKDAPAKSGSKKEKAVKADPKQTKLDGKKVKTAKKESEAEEEFVPDTDEE